MERDKTRYTRYLAAAGISVIGFSLLSLHFINVNFIARFGYWLFGIFGAAVTVAFAVVLAKVENISHKEILVPLPIPILAGVVGAKLLGAVSYALFCISYGLELSFLEFIKDVGAVFYGGMLAFFFTARLVYIKRRRIIDTAAVCFPLFHAFGRIGCYTANCCGGEYLKGIPPQIVEAVGVFLIFAVLLNLYLSGKRGLLKNYLFVYALLRFFTEFLRSDAERFVLEYGKFSISFSQILSLIIIAVTLIFYIKRRIKNGRV